LNQVSPAVAGAQRTPNVASLPTPKGIDLANFKLHPDDVAFIRSFSREMDFVGAGGGFMILRVKGTDRALRIPRQGSVAAVSKDLEEFARGHALWDEMGFLKFHGAYRANRVRVGGKAIDRPVLEMEYVHHFRDFRATVDRVGRNGSPFRGPEEYGQLTGDQIADIGIAREKIIKALGGEGDFQFGIDAFNKVRVVDPPRLDQNRFLEAIQRHLTP
jgi:hypothetical protein